MTANRTHRPRIRVVGAGLAGCEAAWQLARRGVHVTLCEMKPLKMTPAHGYEGFAELVCSNSLKSNAPSRASGLLKEEMRLLGSLIIAAADNAAVPAGSALAVDRRAFSDAVTQALRSHPDIEVAEEEVQGIPEETAVIATGPLTGGALAQDIVRATGGALYFFDAASPIVAADSIDYGRAFFASRYGKDGDYLNCPLCEETYDRFVEALITAECAEAKDFEETSVFEGCMPVEVMARRGRDTLRFGPMRPVGLADPATGRRPWAVAQLRRENAAGTCYNMVGFQTHLRFSEQKRVFSMIPALERMEILRYGVMHRNTYIRSPKALDGFCRLRGNPAIYFAGQITGVEGYVESAASGLLSGIFAAAELKGLEKPVFGAQTALGALLAYVTASDAPDFQPMNINFGIMAPLSETCRKKDKGQAMAARALARIETIKKEYAILEDPHV